MAKPSLIDIGINLCDKSYAADREAVIARAKEVGVSRMVVTGTSVSSSQAATDLAAQHPGVLWSTAGVHPHQAKHANSATLDGLRRMAGAPQVVAIGECGLDYNRNFSPPDVQRKWFEAQVELACDLQMPLFLHERDALADSRTILSKYRDRFPKAVVHCFTGDEEALRAYLDLDLHIGITGWICDERRGLHLRDLLPLIPSNRLLLETDGPYLLPRTIVPKPKSRRNEPKNLPYVLSAVAHCLGKDPEEIANETTQTAIDFFGL